MVYFTCNACGASLKKNQVEKHYMNQCRSCEVLTCIDCQKDFPGDAYKEHTSCISENEKYGGKGWQPKANANKGAKKQAAWLERLEVLLEKLDSSLDKDVKLVLDAIQGYENIPRKRPKFINFCKNVLSRKFASASIEKTWDLFEKAIKEPAISSDLVESKTLAVAKPTSTPETTNGTSYKASFNQWETANLGNDQVNEKFRRLMGMGKSGGHADKPMMTSAKHASSVQDSTKLFANQEQQYEKARAITLSSKGQGLGFAPSNPKEKKNSQNKRKTFDDNTEDDDEVSTGKENGHSNGNNEELAQQNGGINMFKGTKVDQVHSGEISEKKKKKKRKLTEIDSIEGNETKKAKVVENVETQDKFDWIDCVLQVVSKKGSTKMKKLKKKVVNEYLNHYPDTHKTRQDLETKFEKKLVKSKKLKISNDIVSISTSRDD